MSDILVYVDRGVDGGSLKQLMRSLKQEIDPARHTIKRVDAQALISGDWEKNTSLVIVPGGRDIFYHASLDGDGTRRMRSFVHNGGGYLGICAGAYFGCGRIEFEKGGASEVNGDRSLKFFPGLATGPAYGNNKYSYESAQGAEAALISWEEDKNCHVYFNGGCTFEEADTFSNVLIISRYLDLPHAPPSILSVAHGKGLVILSGVHFEYSSVHLPVEEPFLSALHPFLQRGEVQRRTIFRDIIARYGIALQ